jgi:AmiR/NasT family two-component response regulator
MNYIFRKARILVVEDQRIIALDLATTIKRVGHEAIGIETKGERAIKAVEALHPDLVFMDISLAGEIDGIEAARIIHEQFRVPVIYISGNHDSVTIEKSKTTNAYGYLVKPVEDCDISTIINTAIYRFDAEKNSV